LAENQGAFSYFRVKPRKDTIEGVDPSSNLRLNSKGMCIALSGPGSVVHVLRLGTWAPLVGSASNSAGT
jgi:hypothetical protein